MNHKTLINLAGGGRGHGKRTGRQAARNGRQGPAMGIDCPAICFGRQRPARQGKASGRRQAAGGAWAAKGFKRPPRGRQAAGMGIERPAICFGRPVRHSFARLTVKRPALPCRRRKFCGKGE